MTVCTTAQDKKGTAFFQVHSMATLAAEGNLDSAENIIASLKMNWQGSGDGVIASHTANWYIFRVTPTGAEYPYAPIGSLGFYFKADSTTTPVISTAGIYIKTIGGWEKLLSGGGSTAGTSGTGYASYAGTSVKVNEVRAIFPTNSCDNFVYYGRGHATGTSQMMGVIRGYAHSEGNNSSICGGDFTGALDVANHSNGHVAGVHAMAEVKTGLTVTGGALFSLLLTAGLNSACTSLQHGGAAFIALTDQHATNKVKYLLDTGSDGSSMIDSGSGTSHLECYESNGMTFTCLGGFRCYSGASGGDVYIPFGNLAS